MHIADACTTLCHEGWGSYAVGIKMLEEVLRLRVAGRTKEVSNGPEKISKSRVGRKSQKTKTNMFTNVSTGGPVFIGVTFTVHCRTLL